MTTESPREPGADLRDRMTRAASGTSASLDATDIVRRSARRRAPAQVARGAAVSLAVVGIGVAGFTGLRSLSGGAAGTMSSADAPVIESEQSPGDADSGTGSTGDEAISGGAIRQAPAEKISLCGGPLADVAPSETGLVVTATFPASAAIGRVEGSVLLTNTGATRLTGTTPATPAVTLSDAASTVLWHSNGPTILSIVEFDLDPGESIEYPASFEAVVCGVEDDVAESFRTDLPPVATGSYGVSAAIDATLDDGTMALVTGPVAEIALG